MSKKMTFFTVGLAAAVLVAWLVVRSQRQSEFEKQPPVIQAVSEIEKNLKESDQKRQ